MSSTDVRDGHCGRGQGPPGEHASAMAGSNRNTVPAAAGPAAAGLQPLHAKLPRGRHSVLSAARGWKRTPWPEQVCAVLRGLECSICRSGRQRLLAGKGKGLGPRGASDGQVECGGRPVPSRQIDIGGPQAHFIRTLGKQGLRQVVIAVDIAQ